MKNRQYERGQTLAETLVGISLALTVIGGVGFTVSRLGATELHTLATTQSQTVSQQLAQSLDDEARGALAIFIPSKDVNAVANPVPPPGSIAQRGGTVAFDPRVTPVNDCVSVSREIDFYYRDGQHVPHIVAYNYDCANNKVVKYLYSHRDANGAAVGVQTLREYANVTWFGASYLNASQVPDVNPFVRANVHGMIADKLVYMGEPEVYAGNRLVAVQMAVGLATTKNGTTTIADPIEQSLALVPRTFPQSRAVTTSYAPPHDPLSIDCSAFTFQQGTPGSVNQSGTTCGQPSGGNKFIATVPNYIGQYTLQPQNCAAAGVIITASGGTNGPSSGYTIGTGYAVAPGTTVSCVVKVLTSDPAITGSVTVAVVATPIPAPPVVPPPGTPPGNSPGNPPGTPPTNPPTGIPPPPVAVCPPGYIGTFPNCFAPPVPTPPATTQTPGPTQNCGTKFDSFGYVGCRGGIPVRNLSGSVCFQPNLNGGPDLRLNVLTGTVSGQTFEVDGINGSVTKFSVLFTFSGGNSTCAQIYTITYASAAGGSPAAVFNDPNLPDNFDSLSVTGP